MTKILQLEKVTKNFAQAGQTIEIIKNADFSIKSSEFLSLIGPSGSGKTTLLQICGMLDNPSSGAVIINGQNMANANDEKRTKIRKLNIVMYFLEMETKLYIIYRKQLYFGTIY